MGKGLDGARSALRTYGFDLAFVRQVSTAVVGSVISQTPAPGTPVWPNQTIHLVIAKAAPVVRTPAPSPAPTCTPGYDPCLPPAYDYDCAGGSGDGPEYT